MMPSVQVVSGTLSAVEEEPVFTIKFHIGWRCETTFILSNSVTTYLCIYLCLFAKFLHPTWALIYRKSSDKLRMKSDLGKS